MSLSQCKDEMTLSDDIQIFDKTLQLEEQKAIL